MKYAWLRRLGLLVVAFSWCMTAATANETSADRFTVSYYHRFAGSGGPLPVINYSYLLPYQVNTFIQDKRGIEFGFLSMPTITLHARIEEQYNSDHSVARQWHDSAFYSYREDEETTDFSTHSWQVTFDAVFEPLRERQDGPVRAILGVGPFLSLMQDDYDYRRKTVSILPTGYSSMYRTEESGTGLLIGLRGNIGAEWWIRDRIAIVCKTGFEACIFSSTWKEKSSSSSEGPTGSNEGWDKDTNQDNGWQLYNQPVMFGVRVSF